MAAQYSEWFYYDGKKLIFGKPEDSEATPLTYGHDLQEFSMELNPQPNNFNYFTNDYLVNDQHQKKTSEVPNANGYNGFASEKALKMYSKETNVFINGYSDPQSKSRLDKQVEQQKKAADQRQVILKGSSDNPGVALGKIVKIIGEDEHYGSYRVTQITHSANENGRYQNHFEAVSAEMDVYPNTNFNAIPRSETQTATVIENADPDGIGRIKVQFAWQKRIGGNTPWLRIVSPHAGGDKGFHFIPENGEEVLVGFEGGNAERPYVMGSLYNGSGKAESFKSADNDIKTIKTRSGHTIEFNDADGNETINILDKKGNTITLKSSDSSITISAPESITLSSKEINILASETVNIDGTNNVNITSKEVLANGSSKATITSDTKTEILAPSTLVKGDKELKVVSDGMTDIDGKATTNVKGGILNLNCG